MRTTTRFLPGLSAKLQGRVRRRQLETLRARREKARGESISDLGTLFDFVLPLEKLRAVSKTLRDRAFPEVVTFWSWLSQILSGNGSCAQALALVQRWHDEAGLPMPGAGTSSYCRARQRLSEEFLDAVEEMVRVHSELRREGWQRWRGHRLKAIDGTSFQLLDTPENQADYPQPAPQAPGCGFPIVGLVGVVDLEDGRILGTVVGRERRHDAKGLYDLLDTFENGDLLIGDRAFCSYELIALLGGRGVESVMRLHQKREGKLQWRKGRKVGPDSRVVAWIRPPKPGACGITPEEWAALPEAMEVRLVRTRGTDRHGKPRVLYLATTLLDPEAYPEEEIAALYAERWGIEVKFRDIKSTLGLDQLRVKTPEMARKTLRMVRLAYNLIKALQIEAAQTGAVLVAEIGFKGTLDVIGEFRSGFHGLQNRPRLLVRRLLLVSQRIIERLVIPRPGRREPRAVKRRPKPHQYLTSHRSVFRELLHRSRYTVAA